MTKRSRTFSLGLLLILALTLGYFLGTQLGSQSLAKESAPPVEFTGTLNTYPQNLWGTWVIDGHPIQVTRKTHFETSTNALVSGALVHIRAHEENGTLMAESVRVLQNGPYPIDFQGPVDKIAGGTWVIAGKHVRVTAATQIVGPRTANAIARVQAHKEGATLVADHILLSTRAQEADQVEFIGEVQSVHGNIWTVSGAKVLVPAGTTPMPTGTLVRVQGNVDKQGRITVKELAVRPPQVHLTGWIVGKESKNTWQVLVGGEQQRATRRVRVILDNDTPIDERGGTVQEGVRIELMGTAGKQGQIHADFVRVVETGNNHVIGTLTYIPQGDRFAHPWTVDTTPVWITSHTISDRPLSEYRVGDRVAVSGTRRPDGGLDAQMISPSKR